MTQNQIEIINSRQIELFDKQRKINLQKLFTEEGMDALISEIEIEAGSFSADVSTKEGRAKIISMAAKVARCKSPIKELATELKDDSRRLIDSVNRRLSRYEAAMDDLRDRIRQPVTEIEEREAAELKARQDRLAEIERLSTTRAFSTVEDVKGLLKDLEIAFDFDNWGEFQFKAEITYQRAKEYLQSELERGIKYEAEQAELQRLRREAAEREQKDREAEIARQAAEKAKREAEQLAQKVARETAEREQKIAEEKRIAEEKLAANKEHRAKINEQAIKGLVKAFEDTPFAGLSANLVIAIIGAIAKGEVPHVSINY